jgi:hypothetical protein
MPENFVPLYLPSIRGVEPQTRKKFNPRLYEDTRSRHAWTVNLVKKDSEAEQKHRLKVLMRRYPHFSLERLLQLLPQ